MCGQGPGGVAQYLPDAVHGLGRHALAVQRHRDRLARVGKAPGEKEEQQSWAKVGSEQGASRNKAMRRFEFERLSVCVCVCVRVCL